MERERERERKGKEGTWRKGQTDRHSTTRQRGNETKPTHRRMLQTSPHKRTQTYTNIETQRYRKQTERETHTQTPTPTSVHVRQSVCVTYSECRQVCADDSKHKVRVEKRRHFVCEVIFCTAEKRCQCEAQRRSVKALTQNTH